MVLVAAVGIAGNKGAFDRKNMKADTVNAADKEAVPKAAADKEALKKAAAENEAAQSEDTSEKEKPEKADQPEGDDAEEVIAKGQYPIMGKSSVTVDQMVEYFKSSGEKYPADALSKGGADSIETFCQMYYDEAVAEGVRPEVAFVQTMKETGWLQYGCLLYTSKDRYPFDIYVRK